MGVLSRSIPAIALSLLLLAQVTEAQNCYYPNGDLSITDAACSSDGDSACCPLNWDCLSNGICYNPNGGLYGRYTCTDQTWQSSSCPKFCAYAGAGDNSPAPGNQALLQDDEGDWCCDYDGDTSKPCTNQTDAVFFSLPSGSIVASISTLLPTTSAKSVSNAPLTTTQGTPVSTAGDSRSTTSSESPSTASSRSTPKSSSDTSTPSDEQLPTTSSTTTFAQTSTIASSIVTTGSNGAATTIVTTEIQISTPTPTSDPSAAAEPNDHTSRSNNAGLIAGVATGVPVFLLASALLALSYLKRRESRVHLPAISAAHNESYPTSLEKDYGTQVGSLPPDGRAPELDSYPIAPTPSSKDGSSELEASRPTSGVSSMTTAGNGGLHSPAKSQGQGVSPVSNLHVVNEENEPTELWGGYVPYRPPQGGLPPVMQPQQQHPAGADGYAR